MKPDAHKQDLIAIRKWMSKEEYLPDSIDELLLKKFLHSCYYSLERTKECIDKFCTARSTMKELYTSRDPFLPNLRVASSITNIANYTTPTNQEVLIHQLNDPGLEKFNFVDYLKAFTLIGDCWLQEHDFLAEEHIVIMDIKDYSLKIVPKINLMFLKDFLAYLLEAIPVRLKQLHLVNCPAVVDKLFAVIKPLLPVEICNLIKFHSTIEGVYKHVDRKSLPVEFGGEAQSLAEKNLIWLKRVEEQKSYYMQDCLWGCDLKKRPKDPNAVLNGSFRTLDID